MKISLNWIQDESNVDIKGLGIDEILRRIGSQLGAVEDVEDISVRYQGIVIAEVVSCEKHPNADRLNVCKLNDNGLTQDIERDENGLVQVVCGAPNVRAGLKVAWLPPGSTVPSSIPDDPFVLGVRELRGVMSNGMIASPHELAISDYHSGILELDDEAEVGRDFAEFYGLNDTVIDLENKMFTHRPDCFGILGVARELAGITGQKFQSPSWYQGVESNFDVPLSDLPLEAKCETDLVSRFTARVVEGVTVGSSAVRVQSMLTRVGVKPINNIVDLTNYYMYLTAQPTHAFDYDKVKALSSGHPTIFPRMAVQGEKLTLLGGKEITLDQGDIVIATDRQPIALAGIMGGADTEVDENTKNIIVECATFDMYSIRRSSMRHGLFTDASNRFNKGQSPYQNLRVLHKLTNDIAIQTGTKLGEVIDIINCQLAEPNDANVVKKIEINTEFINNRLGSTLDTEMVKTLLDNTEFDVQIESDSLSIYVPFWRMDIEQPEDIVEEVGRLYGYGNIPVVLPSRSISPTSRTPLQQTKYDIRQSLSKYGANEVLTYSFVHGDLLRKVGVSPEETSYHLRNAISPDLQYYRPTLLPSLLAKIHPNIKAQAGSETNVFAIFELGKAHTKGIVDQDDLPRANERLAMVLTADDKTAQSIYGSDSLTNGTAFYLAKRYIDILTNHQATFTEFDSVKHGLEAKVTNVNRSATVMLKGEMIGLVGEVAPSVQKAFKLPAFTAVISLDISHLAGVSKRDYVPLPKFPVIRQDVTLDVTTEVKYADVLPELYSRINRNATDKGIRIDIVPVAIFQPQDGQKRSLSFRISMWHPSRTLAKQEVADLLSAESLSESPK